MAFRGTSLPSRDADDAPAPLTLRYLERFRCTGAACEANCCRGDWSIPVDEKHYEKLKTAYSSTLSRHAGSDPITGLDA